MSGQRAIRSTIPTQNAPTYLRVAPTPTIGGIALYPSQAAKQNDSQPLKTEHEVMLL